MFYGAQYKFIHQLQQTIGALALSDEVKPKDRAACLSAVLAAEKLKREMRGLPPLKAVDVNDFARRNLKRIGSKAAARAILDVDATATPAPPNNLEQSKESIVKSKDGDRTTNPAKPNGENGLK